METYTGQPPMGNTAAATAGGGTTTPESEKHIHPATDGNNNNNNNNSNNGYDSNNSSDVYREKKTPPLTPPATDGSVDRAMGENIFSEGGKNYRTVGRWNTALILITNQIGLGILALPSVVQTLGIVPAVIAIIGIGLLSTYTAYELLQFYRRHPHVVNAVDMARIVGGRPLEVIMGVSLVTKMGLTCASTIVTISVALNTLSSHGVCTAGFIGIAALGCWLLCLPRTFKFIAHIGIPSTISIVAAVLIVIISLGVGNPQGAPPGWSRDVAVVQVVGNPSFREGVAACLNVCYAYAGNIAFVSNMAEMRNPSRDFVPALLVLQAVAIPLYLIAGLAIYCLAGEFTTSPSLGSAPRVAAKVAYGIALPCVLATGAVFGHTAIKYIYVVAMKRIGATGELTSRTVKSWAVWVGCATLFWLLAFVVANAIPIFSSILAISSATFIAWFTFGISAVFWFHMNWHDGTLFSGWRKICLFVLNVFIIVLALFMNSAGLWSAATGLQQVFDNAENEIKGPFTCANNAIF
ncbi:amino acid transporter [Pyricularia oryzae]|uniref:Amino acid transporter n=1 Tax=Pyricularia oryzae (strain Y34) TaxID=1143189 RepID=A0AA97P585_PYRO3|nr:amino acid transporter [Pyricularia oryzae Y34]KAI7914403.1 amino acid transporter [Pyricularia oryzae]